MNEYRKKPTFKDLQPLPPYQHLYECNTKGHEGCIPQNLLDGTAVVTFQCKHDKRCTHRINVKAVL